MNGRVSCAIIQRDGPRQQPAQQGVSDERVIEVRAHCRTTVARDFRPDVVAISSSINFWLHAHRHM